MTPLGCGVASPADREPRLPTPAEPERVAPASASRSGPIPRVGAPERRWQQRRFLFGTIPAFSARPCGSGCRSSGRRLKAYWLNCHLDGVENNVWGVGSIERRAPPSTAERPVTSTPLPDSGSSPVNWSNLKPGKNEDRNGEKRNCQKTRNNIPMRVPNRPIIKLIMKLARSNQPNPIVAKTAASSLFPRLIPTQVPNPNNRRNGAPWTTR